MFVCCSSLHQSLSKEQSWRDQYNNSLDQMQQMLTQREGHVIDAQKETNKLQATIQQLTDERETLRMELEKIQACDSDRQLVNERSASLLSPRHQQSRDATSNYMLI